MGYVILEGIDAVGKSTLVNNLKPRYQNATFTSHPGATPLGRILRRLSKYPNDFKGMDTTGSDIAIDPVSTQLLMLIDQVVFINTLLIPKLQNNELVFADRANYISAITYGLAHGASLSEIDQMLKLINSPTPDIVIVLTAPLDVITKRIELRGGLDKFETTEMRKSVHKYYSMLKTDKDISEIVQRYVPLDRIHYVDATQPEQVLTDCVANLINKSVWQQ